MEKKQENQKKRILYRATHRGGKELDYVLGNFCQYWTDTQPANTWQDLELLLDADEQDLLQSLLNPQKAAMSVKNNSLWPHLASYLEEMTKKTSNS